MEDNNIDPLFWLPSDFLTDDDHNNQLPTEFPFDFTELTRHFASQNKWALSQSILSPVLSNGSPNGPSHGPSSPTAPFSQKDEQSWNLLCAAAGEVNMWKMRNEFANKSRPLPNIFNTHVKQNNGSMWGQPFGVSGDQYGYGLSGNAKCVRVQYGWPTSQVQKQRFNVNGCVSRPTLMFSGGGVALKRKCAGTGVFLPRTCLDTTVKPGCPASFIPSRPAPTLNLNCNYEVMTKAQAQHTIGGVTPDHDAMLTHDRNAVLTQQWHNGMNMMGNRTMDCKMLLPEEWSY